jgi:redox-sensitive bicupin YhaK (pirin superfamily)
MFERNESLNAVKDRNVARVITSVRAREGAGFYIRRPFPTSQVDNIDPFLLLDHMEPLALGPGEAKGAPDHPHRGFETVTYLLEGGMVHKDSAGNSGKLGPGDVQWMTAGSGVVHSEMPDRELLRNGGKLHGFQLWVNLPRQDKMVAPRYQDTPASRIPVAKSEDGTVTVKVIAGESLGQHAVVETRIPILYLHVTLEPNAVFSQPVPTGFNVFSYVVEGSGRFGPDHTEAGPDQLVLFRNDGDSIRLKASTENELSALIIGGTPLKEPIARYGPFVMNTEQEIVQAFEDFRSGRMGEITVHEKN